MVSRSRFAVNLQYLFTEWPMPERFEAAAREGFDKVEIGLPYAMAARELAARLADNGLAMLQMATPPREDGTQNGAWPGRQAEFRDGVAKALDYAGEVGCDFVHVVAGERPNGFARDECFTVFAENLGHAVRQATTCGMRVIIEPVARARFSGYLYHSLDEALGLIGLIDHPGLGLCFDTYHVHAEEGDPARQLDRVAPRVAYVQLGDGPGRGQPGSGSIDFDSVFSVLRRIEWNGPIACEYIPTHNTRESFEWIEEF